jgi:hypothetical protein
MNRWQTIDRTSAGRPSLAEDETILFVQNSVGLYDGYNLRQRLIIVNSNLRIIKMELYI